MAEKNQQRPAIAEPALRDFAMPESGDLAVIQREATTPMFRFKDFAMTAEKVAITRSKRNVLGEIERWCAAYPDRYLYSWEVNDRRNKRKVLIEGPTIKMAEMVARCYGNCFAGIVHIEKADKYWTLYAAFIDFETGFNLVRPFEQRMDQKLGMGDESRERDILLQIAASKATRNVIVNALDPECQFGIEVIGKNLLQWANNPEKRAKIVDFINDVMERFQIDIRRVERVIGRKRKDWSPRELVRVLLEMRSINDESIRPTDIYPPLEASEPTDDAPPAKAKEEAEKKPAKQQASPPESKEPEGQEPAAASGPSEPPVDKQGEVFDPAVHRVDDAGKPVLTKAGNFSKKRGRPEGSTKKASQPEQAQEGPQEPAGEAPSPEAQQTAPPADVAQAPADGPPVAQKPSTVDDPYDLGIDEAEGFSFDD